ncbi:MAG: sodium:solute symporter, partial [Fulvivirga sp.]
IILFIGAMVFVFYQFNQPPVFFNDTIKNEMQASENASKFNKVEKEYETVFSEKRQALDELVVAIQSDEEAAIDQSAEKLNSLQSKSDEVRNEAKKVIAETLPDAETNDKDYIFMNFVMNNLPIGIVGLLFAVIFSAAMSSTSSELNALGSTTTIDFYKRKIKQNLSDSQYLRSSKLFTLVWGIIAIIFASYLSLFENLIQAVNLIGSLFYPIVLGIFIVAFFVKSVKADAVFIAAIVSQVIIGIVHYLNINDAAGLFTMGFLWYNAFGCLLVVVISYLLQQLMPTNK